MIKNRIIPTINIAPLTKKNFNSKKVNNIVKQIESACAKIGFFQITGHGISIKKIKTLCNVGNNFFKSTSKNKNKLAPKKWNKSNKLYENSTKNINNRFLINVFKRIGWRCDN